MTNTSAIKVKAMALFAAHDRLLVTPSFDTVKHKPHYRLLGGHVEFGERAEETLKREMLEELGAEVEVLQRLDVVQNMFSYEERRYHEVAFIHHARFLDDAFNARNEMPNLDAESGEIFKWLPVAELIGGPVPLYPAADYPRLLAMIGKPHVSLDPEPGTA